MICVGVTFAGFGKKPLSKRIRSGRYSHHFRETLPRDGDGCKERCAGRGGSTAKQGDAGRRAVSWQPASGGRIFAPGVVAEVPWWFSVTTAASRLNRTKIRPPHSQKICEHAPCVITVGVANGGDLV